MKDREKKKRRTYAKPELRFIDLVADQVLTSGCKTSSGGWAFGSTPCTASGCGGGGS